MRHTKQHRPNRIPRRKVKANPWPEWQAKGYTLPSDEELHRLSQADAVASAGGRLIPYPEPQQETDQ